MLLLKSFTILLIRCQFCVCIFHLTKVTRKKQRFWIYLHVLKLWFYDCYSLITWHDFWAFVFAWVCTSWSFAVCEQGGDPDSITDSQQPFLVLDGAVRMHWIVPSLSVAGGMFSFIREWKNAFNGVFLSLRTNIFAHRKVEWTYKHIKADRANEWHGDAVWGNLTSDQPDLYCGHNRVGHVTFQNKFRLLQEVCFGISS